MVDLLTTTVMGRTTVPGDEAGQERRVARAAGCPGRRRWPRRSGTRAARSPRSGGCRSGPRPTTPRRSRRPADRPSCRLQVEHHPQRGAAAHRSKASSTASSGSRPGHEAVQRQAARGDRGRAGRGSRAPAARSRRSSRARAAPCAGSRARAASRRRRRAGCRSARPRRAGVSRGRRRAPPRGGPVASNA